MMLSKQIFRRLVQTSVKKWANVRKTSGLVHNHASEGLIVRSRIPDLDIPSCCIPEFVWQKLDIWHAHTALVCNSTGRQYTYEQCRRMSYNLARSLRAQLGLQKGQVIAVLLPNVPEYAIAVLGSLEAGLTVTTVNPIYTAEEINRQLVDSGAKAIITLVSLHQTAQTASKGTLTIITIKHSLEESIPQGSISFLELCSKEHSNIKLEHNSPEDIALMPYSSGTTGLPKGVELTHRNIVANLVQSASIDSDLLTETTKYHQDSVSCVLPMFHIYGLTVNMFKMFSAGTKLITLPRFTPENYIEMLAKNRPNHLFVVPPIVIFLAAHPNVLPSHMEATRTVFSGAAPLGATDMERLIAKVGREIIALQGYGMTESSPGITFTFPDSWKECFGSIGVGMPNTQLKVVSIEDGVTPLGPNEKGELFVKGPQIMRGYHNNQKATDEVFQDGFLKTGDMVYYDEKQIFWIIDRLKELIKVKGFQVAPAELETIIRTHPSVADAAVIGVPHPLWGETPRAYIVPKKDAKIQASEVQHFVANQVASYKKIDGGVSIINAIPKNLSGKILRRQLKEMYNAEKKD